MKENEIESYEIENDIRYDEEFRSFLKKVLGVLWALCIVGIFVGGDLEGGGGILTPFAYLAFFPIVIIPIWLIFGRWKFLAISLIFFLFLFCMSLVFGIQYKALRNSQEIGSFIAFLSLIGIAGTLLIALIRAVWGLIKKGVEMKRQVRLKLLIGAVSFFAFIGCDSGGFVPKNEEEKAMLQWAKTEAEASDVEFLSIEQARKEFGLPEDCPHRDQIIFRGVKGDEGINGIFAKTKNGGIKVFYVQCKKAANGYECNGNIQNPARNAEQLNKRKAEYKKFC